MSGKKLNRALIDATVLNDLAEMKRLLGQGADPDARDPEHQETPLMRARSDESARLLLRSGADVNARDERGWTPLILTRRRLLLDHGADVNAQDSEGQTCLMHAVQRADSDTVRWLIDSGADLETKDEDGHTAADIAKTYGMTWLVNELQRPESP